MGRQITLQDNTGTQRRGKASEGCRRGFPWEATLSPEGLRELAVGCHCCPLRGTMSHLGNVSHLKAKEATTMGLPPCSLTIC